MPNVYSYRARDITGKVISGQIQAEDLNRAAEMLRVKKMIILDLAPGATKKQGITLFQKKGIPLKQFATFCRQMATMTKAGVTIMSSISAIASQVDNPNLASALADVGKDLESGKTFSEACSKQQSYFPSIFINMVEAGEASGALDEVLERMAEYFEGQSEIAEKVKSATTYPSFIGGIAVAVAIGMMLTVIPNFADIFESSGMDLPMITQMLLNISEIMQKYFFFLILGLGAAIFVLVKYLKTTKGRHSMQRLMLKLPKFGTIFQNSAISRFARALSILTSSGVPMIQGLEIVARVVNNVEYSSAILHARKSVSEGLTLSQGLSSSPRFTPMVLHMIKVGEDSGALDVMLEKVADFYESEVKYTVERLSSILEPMLILFLALIVGTMLVGVMLPMFNMGDLAV